MARRLLIALAVVVALVVGAGAWVLYQHSYDLSEEQVTITGGVQPLDGVLARPKDRGASVGLVVIVHGDGDIDATYDGFYRPIWESFARAGYAVLSWDKPADWLDQSMDDRAAETVAAVEWARSVPGVDSNRIGLWGSSQAGWVLPKVAARTELTFVIAVSPAINWLRQGRYNLLAALRADGAGEDEIERAVSRSDLVREQLGKGATYEQFLAAGGDPGDIDAKRWVFAAKNFGSDATAELRHVRVPVLLMLGGHDVNVDVAETEAVYRDTVGALTVQHYPDATHAMVRKRIEDSDALSFVTAVAAPRSLFAAGYLSDLRRFVAAQEAVQTGH